jgi:hypothetical protein
MDSAGGQLSFIERSACWNSLPPEIGYETDYTCPIKIPNPALAIQSHQLPSNSMFTNTSIPSLNVEKSIKWNLWYPMECQNEQANVLPFS